MTRRIAGVALSALAASLLSSAAIAGPAAAQTPVAPANGEKVPGDNVVLRWTLEPGWHTACVQWANRPETSFPGGPFLAPDSTTCSLGPQDVAYLLNDLTEGRYYWHVDAETCVTAGDDCRTQDAWGPTAYFDSVAPPLPPRPKGCSTKAADVMADDFIIPYAKKDLPSYYKDITGDVKWARLGPICRDLTGDGDREMIVRLGCCTGSSLGPWAIFKHDSTGQWRMAYVQVRDTVFQLRVRRRVVRTMLPAPYEGACTRYVRYREVRWNGSRFHSRLTRRSRLRRTGC